MYARKNKHANDIKFEEIIRKLKEFILSLNLDIVTIDMYIKNRNT